METNQTNQNGYSDNLPIGDIFVKEGFNPRKYFDPTEHLELVGSIKENGIVQPIVVRPVTKGTGGFWVVCGERRFRAAKDAGLSHVPAVVRELGEASAMVIAIIENAQRANITPAEEAQSARDVLMGCGNDRQEAIRLLGWSQSRFDSRMLLLHADQAVLDALTERKIKLGHAELLSQLPTDFQVNTLAKIIAEGFSVSDLKGKLALFSLDLSKACFDKTECKTCPHNSSLQASVFDDHIEGGKCANHDCYGAKTKAAMENKKVGLYEQYAVVFFDTERTKGSYAINCQLGQNGVGKAQFEQGCRQCGHFGALLNTSPDQLGKVTEDCCFNLECHKEKVATYQASIKPGPATTTGKPANKTTATDKKGTLASGDTKQPSNEGTGASAAMIPGKVTEKIETFYRDLAAKTVAENQRLMLCLNTFTLLRFVKSSFVDELWPDSIRKNASVTLELDRFLKRLSTLDMHLEPWLIDAMRYLVQKKRWVPNEDNGRVWQGQDGVFLLWPLAASDMQYQLRESECPFVPSTDEILAEILLDAGIIASSNGMNRYLFEIAVPVADSSEKKHVEAIKLTRHEILFIKTDHQPLGFDLLVEVIDEEDGQGKAVHEITESSPNPQEAVNPVSVTETPEIDIEPVGMNILFDKQAAPVMGHKATKEKPGGTEENPGLEALFSDDAVSSNINLYDDDYVAEYRHEKAQKYPSGSTRIPARSPRTQMDGPGAGAGAGAGQNTQEDLLGSLIGSSRTKPETGQVKPTGLPKENKSEINGSDQGRSTMILSRLKKLPEEYLEARPGGITKVISKGLKAINLELKDCVSVLKADGLLILVDGYESGLDSTAKPKSRYFLVKADLLNDK